MRLLKVISMAILLLLLSVIIYCFFSNNQFNEQSNKNLQSENESTEDSGDRETLNTDQLIKDTIDLAKEGKVRNAVIVAGKTTIQELEKRWGAPDQSEETVGGIYANYKKKEVTIGYQNKRIFDIRSSDDNLQKLHYKDVRRVSGEPSATRYYQDNAHDQIILVYRVNENYQLKWIFPNPTNNKKNPTLDHISVVTSIEQNDDPKIQSIISDMSLDEKIGQMIFAGISGHQITNNEKALIHTYNVGGFIFYQENIGTDQQTIDLVNQLKTLNQESRLPLFLGVDQEGGDVSRLSDNLKTLPTNKEIGVINNSNFSNEVGKLLGRELKTFGMNFDFAPVLDVNSNPNNPIIGNRSFGNNPKIVSKLGVETMKGIQSEGVVSVVKHFPGHGDTSTDSHLQLPIVDKTLEELQSLELIPFSKAIDNGADVVMTAHILLPEIDDSYPSTMSEAIITGLLREQLNYDGVVISDDMTMDAISNNYDIGNATVQSVKAGSDIILIAHEYKNVMDSIQAIKSAVKDGEISEESINKSVSRIIALKRKYELNDNRIELGNVGQLNDQIKQTLEAYMN